MIQLLLPEIVPATVTVYCNTPLTVDGETLTFQETRNIRVFLKTMSYKTEQFLPLTTTWLDEFAEEIWYITGYGVSQAHVKMHHAGKLIPLIRRTYAEYPPLGLPYLFALEFFIDWTRILTLPYAHPTNQRFPGTVQLQHATIYPVSHTAFQEHPLFQRLVRRSSAQAPLPMLYLRQREYHPYALWDGVSLGTLPKTRQSLIRQGTKKIQKKFKELKQRQERQVQRERLRHGKKPRIDYIYLIHIHDDLFKIGVSTRPQKRLQTLQTSSPHKLTLHHTFPAEPGQEAEQKLHRFFSAYRREGEWFQLSEQYRQCICDIHAYEAGKFLTTQEHSEVRQLNKL